MTRDLSVIFPLIVAVLYLGSAAAHCYNGRYAWSFVWTCYAAANIGLILVGDSK